MARAAIIALPCAFALHFAFPRADLPWVAPFALAGLYVSAMMLSPRGAALVGFCAGLTFFGADFAWFGETAGALLGPLGGLLDLGPAALEAVSFAAAWATIAWATGHVRAPWLPVFSASAFTLAEMVRSSGTLGAPLYQIGAAFVDTPLAAIGAYGGVYAMTFAVCLLSASLAVAVRGLDRSPRRMLPSVALCGVVALAAWMTWPARTAETATFRVAAVQGNITQSVKWDAAALPLAVERYSSLTTSARVRAFKPRFILWPETVITTDLRLDGALAAQPSNASATATAARLSQGFARLAHQLDAVVAVGSNEATASRSYNDIFFFVPNGDVLAPYRKRKLVPFAEYLPGPSWLRGVPFASLVSDFGAGDDLQPFGPYGAAPLICWEAGFSGLAQRQAAGGAAFFAISTDDAWFGSTDGPYAQAQLAQLRAVETGRWIVRAAATGISGIVGPDGRWRERSVLGTRTVILGKIGPPQPTVYSRLGPVPIGFACTGVGIAVLCAGRRRRV